MNFADMEKYKLDEAARLSMEKRMPRMAANTLVYAVLLLCLCLLQQKPIDALKSWAGPNAEAAIPVLNIVLLVFKMVLTMVLTYKVMGVAFLIISVSSNINYFALMHFGLPTEEVITNTNNLFTTVVEADNRTEAEEKHLDEQYKLEYEAALKAYQSGKPVKIVCRHCNGVKLLGEACPYCGITI